MSTDLVQQPTVEWKQGDERRLWKKLARFAARLSFADELVASWYCATDPATPMRVKAVLLGALAYFLLPADAIPDILAVVGFTDDAAVLMAAIGSVASHMRPEHREAARHRLDELLS